MKEAQEAQEAQEEEAPPQRALLQLGRRNRALRHGHARPPHCNGLGHRAGRQALPGGPLGLRHAPGRGRRRDGHPYRPYRRAEVLPERGARPRRPLC